MNGITLITCTADSPEAFRLCELWFSRQNYTGNIQWIVSDGGTMPVECRTGQLHLVNGDPGHPRQNFRNNLLRALERVEQDKILFFEHDDWYHPDYLQQMNRWLDQVELVGETGARYYNVSNNRYLFCGNRRHASLCQTGIRSELVPLLIHQIQHSRTSFIDLRLWKNWSVGRTKQLHPYANLNVGIKGIPGKPGIGVGHRLSERHRHDPDWGVLRSWIGNDVEVYQELGERASLSGES